MNIIYYDSKDNVSTHSFSSFKLNYCQNENAIDFILITADHVFSYTIHPDNREPSIESIKEYIVQELQNAFLNKSVFYITEYNARNYIFIGNADCRRQFTATINE